MYNFDKYFFSRRGSYLAVDKDRWRGGIKVSTVRNVTGGVNDMFHISGVDEASACFEPWEFSAKTENGDVNICFFGMDNMYLCGHGELMLEYEDYSNRYIANYHYYDGDRLCLCDYKTGAHQCYIPINGSVSIDAPKSDEPIKSKYIKVILHPDESGKFEVALEQFYTPSPILTYMDNPYGKCVSDAKADYLEFEKQLECQNETDRAAYVLWTNIVSPSGCYKGDAVLMSKAGMGAVWSWDNVINAIALAKYDFDLSYEQFVLPYRFMDEYGCVPDSIRADYIDRVYVKPPIQGFVYPYLAKFNEKYASTEILSEVYSYVKKNTEWWIRMRGKNPYYLHGNDSGADNATCFDEFEVMASPELAALLSVQCSFLAETAEKLCIFEDIEKYRNLAENYFKSATEDYFDGKLFFKEAFGNRKVYSNSLLPLRMLVLGKKLPKDILNYILERISNHHIGKSGLSTEALDSPLYTEDGYWRGPAWSPDQVIFAFALLNIEEYDLALKISEAFSESVAKHGFFENMSSTEERGLRAKCYSWTAAAYIICNLIKDQRNEKTGL